MNACSYVVRMRVGLAHRIELSVGKTEQLPPQVEPGVEEEVASHELHH